MLGPGQWARDPGQDVRYCVRNKIHPSDPRPDLQRVGWGHIGTLYKAPEDYTKP